MSNISNLSPHAVSFPVHADLVLHILTNFNIFLKLESKAIKDNTYYVLAPQFLQAQKSLQEQLSCIISADKPNPSAQSNISQPSSNISSKIDTLNSSVPSLTNRQRKQQLRASNYRAAKLTSSSHTVSVDTLNNTGKFNKSKSQRYPNSTRPKFSKYLQDEYEKEIKIRGSLVKTQLPVPVLCSNISQMDVLMQSLPIGSQSNYTSKVLPTIVSNISSYSTIKSFLPRRPPKPLLPTVSLQSRSIVLPTIHQPPWPSNWPTNYSNVFKLFSMQYFFSQGYIFEKYLSLSDIRNKVNTCDDSISISDFFHFSLVSCSITFCNKYLQCCELCGLTSKDCGDSPICWKYCSDCSVPHRFFSCPKFHLWLHDPNSPYHSDWMDIVRNHLNTTYVPTFKLSRK